MKALKQWASVIITDAILFASAYYWLVNKVDGAGNIFMFIIWFFIVSTLIHAINADRTWFEKNPSAPGIRAHGAFARLLIIILLAYTGYFWAAGFYTIASLLLEVARVKKPMVKEGV